MAKYFFKIGKASLTSIKKFTNQRTYQWLSVFINGYQRLNRLCLRYQQTPLLTYQGLVAPSHLGVCQG